MSDSVIVTGMVLTAMPIGDYDKRITILTVDRGKITAFARGARRPKSSLVACTNPFSFGEFELYPGKSSYTLVKANIQNYFRELTIDPFATYMGFYFCEFAEYCCQENNDEKEMLKLLYQSLRALQSDRFEKSFVRAIYEDKALTLIGEGPNVYRCMECGAEKPLVMFAPDKGGLLCDSCAGKHRGIHISDATRYTLQYIANSSVEKLYSFTVTPEVLEELIHVITVHKERMIRHRFKSLEVMDALT
ncbi:MAG: DNA repair protein RecO [Lachnospiraceae bacterium]|nr:DNA repair protein RecO [Lachnospiraceae bacterium]